MKWNSCFPNKIEHSLLCLHGESAESLSNISEINKTDCKLKRDFFFKFFYGDFWTTLYKLSGQMKILQVLTTKIINSLPLVCFWLFACIFLFSPLSACLFSLNIVPTWICFIVKLGIYKYCFRTEKYNMKTELK